MISRSGALTASVGKPFCDFGDEFAKFVIAQNSGPHTELGVERDIHHRTLTEEKLVATAHDAPIQSVNINDRLIVARRSGEELCRRDREIHTKQVVVFLV
jgi:hypothetical protein